MASLPVTTVTTSRGFSLIEVLVSMSIFATVVTIGVGSLLVLIDANAKAQNTQAVINNVAFVVDSMVRDIRTGFYYQCTASSGSLNLTTNTQATANCPTGAGNFAFTETGASLTGVEGGRIGYRFNAADGSIERNVRNTGWRRITAPDVVIDTFDFVVTGAAASDDISPVVTIFISGQAGEITGIDSAFELQTTITQQSLDI